MEQITSEIEICVGLDVEKKPVTQKKQIKTFVSEDNEVSQQHHAFDVEMELLKSQYLEGKLNFAEFRAKYLEIKNLKIPALLGRDPMEWEIDPKNLTLLTKAHHDIRVNRAKLIAASHQARLDALEAKAKAAKEAAKKAAEEAEKAFKISEEAKATPPPSLD